MDIEEIIRGIDAKRARRPNGYATRCERCRFWEADKYDDAFADEDQTGECHRYAPQIPHHHVAEALGKIAWAIEELANVEHAEDFDYSYETVQFPYSDWPRTSANFWCGEFQERL